MDARVRPSKLPLIEIGLSFIQTFEALSFQWCLLRVAYTRLHFPFTIGISDSARHRHHAVVRQHIAVERIQCGIVDVRTQYAFS